MILKTGLCDLLPPQKVTGQYLNQQGIARHSIGLKDGWRKDGGEGG